jgi:hypothetical protein
MQAAKKLVLVDEFDREYKRLQRPADVVTKTNRSLQLSDTLRDQSLADDHKVREYVGALHRYLNVSNRVPEQPTVEVNWSTEPRQKPTLRKSPPKHQSRTRKRKQGQRVQWEQY